jgi:3-hydroxyisobutyrate dehydrogenase-like beta-hydroxyacid dehydrogenase
MVVSIIGIDFDRQGEKMIGFIGVGVMGEPICRHIASKSGKEVRAYDTNPAPLERLKADGVKAAESVREVAEKSEIVFLSLPGAVEVKQVCVGRASLLIHQRPGTYIVDLSTTPVGLTRDLEGRFAARGIHFVDAPVARTRAAAEEGKLSVMVGCKENFFARVKPYLDYFATDVTRCGPPGAGQAMKIINNMVLFQNVLALAEALAVIRRLGLDPTKALETLSKGSADSFALRHHGMKAMLPNQFPEKAFSVEYALKDIGYALELAKLAKIDLTGLKTAKAALEKAAAAGHTAEYFPVIAKLI